jgi:soluble lytic murein transglycosylase
MQAARRHDEQALSLYAKLKNSELDQDEIAWKVRAALLERNLALVLATIDDMQVTQQEEQPWRVLIKRKMQFQKPIQSFCRSLVNIRFTVCLQKMSLVI